MKEARAKEESESCTAFVRSRHCDHIEELKSELVVEIEKEKSRLKRTSARVKEGTSQLRSVSRR